MLDKAKLISGDAHEMLSMLRTDRTTGAVEVKERLSDTPQQSIDKLQNTQQCRSKVEQLEKGEMHKDLRLQVAWDGGMFGKALIWDGGQYLGDPADLS